MDYNCCIDEDNWEEMYSTESERNYWCCIECGHFIKWIDED